MTADSSTVHVKAAVEIRNHPGWCMLHLREIDIIILPHAVA